MSELTCPFCEAEFDEVALATNICSACGNILGGIGDTICTIRLERSGFDAIDEQSAERGDNMATVDMPAPDAPQPVAAAPLVSANLRRFSAGDKDSPDYCLLDKIGEGGMGRIYSARQNTIGRTVALKVLNANNQLKDSGPRKFKAEAAVTGNLEHPNIVPIYDLGVDEEGRIFYAMKQVRGVPWSSALEARSLPENIEILLKVCDAVAFAHSKGIIHRDLKPENVMLGEFGEVLLMDWGLAAGTLPDSKAPRVSFSDAIAGTPAYMAPEMALGIEDRINSSSDIYLLGGILYEIITGRPPHGGKNVRECLANAAENIIEEPWIKSELLKTAMKAMSREQYDRYENVREFQRTIREHYRSVEIATRARKFHASAKKSGDYHDYFRALFGFEEALDIWQGNENAALELREAGEGFAALAEQNGDVVLAASLRQKLVD